MTPADKVLPGRASVYNGRMDSNVVCEVISVKDESVGTEQSVVRWRLCRSVIGPESRPPSRRLEGERTGEPCHSLRKSPCRSNGWCGGPEKHQCLGWRAREGPI